jgi:acetyl esterase/lipase
MVLQSSIMDSNIPSRTSLWVKVVCMRILTKLVSLLHRIASPRPPAPDFWRTIPATISHVPGYIHLAFYTPKQYQRRNTSYKYPVVLNFHGGGFIVGSPTDDARWAQIITEHSDAIVVSVDYRMAPEHPFPTAVEDGVDAMLYLTRHASELSIDTTKISTSGFSAGGNLAITVPLRYAEEQRKRQLDGSHVERKSPKFAAMIAWYPSTDFTITRDARRASCPRPEKTLPKAATDIFDYSYLYPPGLDLSSPFLSPGVASDDVLRSLPDNIILYTCEWDMLQAEAERFGDRCRELGKRVRFRKVEKVVHGWDKSANPFLDFTEINKLYIEACHHLNDSFR